MVEGGGGADGGGPGKLREPRPAVELRDRARGGGGVPLRVVVVEGGGDANDGGPGELREPGPP